MDTIPTQSALIPVVSDKLPSLRFLSKLVCIVALFASISRSHATLDFYESFNYTNVNVQLANAALPTWIVYAGGGVHPMNISGSLSYPVLATTSGDNSVLFDGAGATGVTAHNLAKIYSITNTTTLYYSLTFKVTFINTNDWGGSGNWMTGSFMLGFNQKATNGTAIAAADAAASLLIRTGDPNNWGGGTSANDFQQYQLGVGVTATTSARVFSPTHQFNPGETLFIVVSYTFNPGSSDDVAKLYVNPIPGSSESDNSPIAISTGFAEVSNNQIRSFFLRNNSVEPASTQIDDLRVGTTWADVTPVDPHALRVESVPPNVVVSWPIDLYYAGFVLETNSTLNTNWSTLTDSPGLLNGRFCLTNSSPSGSFFYRLRK